MSSWLSILESVRVGGKEPGDPGTAVDIADWEKYVDCIVTGIHIGDQHGRDIRVDGIPLLYELMGAVREICLTGKFCAEIGEGIRMRGAKTADRAELVIAFEAGGRSDLIHRHEASFSSVLLFLCKKIAETEHSLRLVGVDVEELFSRYPLENYKSP